MENKQYPEGGGEGLLKENKVPTDTTQTPPPLYQGCYKVVSEHFFKA